MVILNLLIGLSGLFMAGRASTLIQYDHRILWSGIMLGEIVIGTYFTLAAIGHVQ
jgi:hypothetical protein